MAGDAGGIGTVARRIRVGACEPGGWWWEVGRPGANEHSIVSSVGQGRARTRWGAVRKAKKRIRELDRQARRRARGLTIDVR